MNDQAKNKIVDRCPEWAHKQLLKVRALEVQLGNIPGKDDFFERELADAFQKVLEDTTEDHADNEFVDQMFAKIVVALSKEGFSDSDIAIFANNRIGYKGGPPYCNVSEVREAIDDADQ